MKANLFWDASICRLKLVTIYSVISFISFANSIRWITALKALFARAKRNYQNCYYNYFFHTANV